MTNLIKTDFHGDIMQFRDDGWFNATVAAAKFDKRPVDWLHLREAVEYISALAEGKGNCAFLEQFNKINNLEAASAASQAKLLRLAKQTGFVKTKQGAFENGGGTWLHPDLAVVFARWLDVRFAIWCDQQIKSIIYGQPEKTDWKRVRHQASVTYKVMSEMLEMKREEGGKKTEPYHYANEAKLVNWAMTGEFKPLDREALSMQQLDELATLEKLNALLIAQDVSRDERKQRLLSHVSNMRALALQ